MSRQTKVTYCSMLLATTLSLGGCGDEGKQNKDPATGGTQNNVPTGLVVRPGGGNLAPGGNVHLSVDAQYGNRETRALSATQNVTWRNQSEQFAMLTSTGSSAKLEVKPDTPIGTQITVAAAVATLGFTGNAVFTVQERPVTRALDSLAISPSTFKLGEPCALIATANERASDSEDTFLRTVTSEASWKSENPEILAMDEASPGACEAKQAGSTTVTATYRGTSAKRTVTITEPTPTAPPPPAQTPDPPPPPSTSNETPSSPADDPPPKKCEFKDPNIAMHWAHREISGLCAASVMSGFDDNTFRPDEVMSRRLFAVVLVSAFERRRTPAKVSAITATDVPLDHWTTPYIARALQQGWMTTVTNTKTQTIEFFPGSGVTAEDAVRAIATAANPPPGSIADLAMIFPANAHRIPPSRARNVARLAALGTFKNYWARRFPRLDWPNGKRIPVHAFDVHNASGLTRAEVASWIYYSLVGLEALKGASR